jgi:hypothetical protein
MNVIAELQNWFESNADGTWEHVNCVKIETLDNPGWSVEVDLTDKLLDKPFREISDLDPDEEWIRCWIENQKFKGVGGVHKLEEIIKVFLNWAK